MAFLIKNTPTVRTAGVAGNGQAILSQWVHVVRPSALTNVNATTEMCFRVFGGRVLVHLLSLEVTVLIGAGATTHKWSSKRLDAAGVAVGSAVDLTAASASLANREVGASLVALGSGAAGIISNAGAYIMTLGRNSFIVPQGEIYSTTAGADTTGSVKYDLWYQPLDEGAYVVAQPALTTVI